MHGSYSAFWEYLFKQADASNYARANFTFDSEPKLDDEAEESD